MNSFREETWWWEGTVAARKIIIAMIGVFGGDMNDMQVHMTLMFVVVVILITSQVRPFGGLKHGILHILEMASLMAIFLTLWAGSVFNTRPKCQDPLKDEGSTLPWCDALSVTVGLIDIFVLAVIVFCFVYMKVTSKAVEDVTLVNLSQVIEMTQRQDAKSTAAAQAAVAAAEMESNGLGTGSTKTMVAVNNPMRKMGATKNVKTKRLSKNSTIVVDSNGVEWQVLLDPKTNNNYFVQVNDDSKRTWIDPSKTDEKTGKVCRKRSWMRKRSKVKSAKYISIQRRSKNT